MSPGNMCHGGTNYLTEKYVEPIVSLGIVAGERIPSERSPANIPQRQVAKESIKGTKHQIKKGSGGFCKCLGT
nr:hypothetical protein [Tanacetum cinerariifolium]